jgi:hypothetical protein
MSWQNLQICLKKVTVCLNLARINILEFTIYKRATKSTKLKEIWLVEQTSLQIMSGTSRILLGSTRALFRSEMERRRVREKSSHIWWRQNLQISVLKNRPLEKGARKGWTPGFRVEERRTRLGVWEPGPWVALRKRTKNLNQPPSTK